MHYTYPIRFLRAQRPVFRALGYWPAFILAGLLWACNLSQSSDIKQVQIDNIRLTKTLHDHLNHHNWQAVEKLCAETVRYRGRATHFAEVDEPKARFLAHYRKTLNGKRTGPLEIRQLYPAGAYHVIVEARGVSRSPDDLPVCLIYTIENQHVTRLYAY